MELPSVRTKTSLWLSGIALVLLGGCGEGGPSLGSVSGKITLDGEPVKGAIVQFIPQGPGGTPSYGLSDKEGIYKMEFSSSASGVLTGKSLVRISSNDDVTINGKTYSSVEVFPDKYNEGSEVIADIVAGENKLDYACESTERSKRAMSRKRGPSAEDINF